MGEYAKRLRDGNQVKIGTCESMYYCRYEQLKDVDYPYKSDNCFWRIPNPDEDGTEVGDYKDYLPLSYNSRGQDYFIPHHLTLKPFDQETSDALCENVKIVQATVSQLGMLVNIPCYHGLRLPESGNGIKFFWNGKRDALYLSSLKNTEDELRVVVQCAACQQSWSFSFIEIMPYIKSLWMKLRLFHQCADYFFEHTGKVYDFAVEEEDGDGNSLKIFRNDKCWISTVNDVVNVSGTWEEARNMFIKSLKPCEYTPGYEDEAYFKHEDIVEMRHRYVDTPCVIKRLNDDFCWYAEDQVWGPTFTARRDGAQIFPSEEEANEYCEKYLKDFNVVVIKA